MVYKSRRYILVSRDSLEEVALSSCLRRVVGLTIWRKKHTLQDSMAQSVVRLPGTFNLSFGGSSSGSLHGESLPCAIPSRKQRYAGEKASHDGTPHSRSPPGVKAYLTDTSDVDHFTTLGVSRGASKREIKSAYRRLALQYHPDVCTGDSCNRKFLQITTAYERALEGVAPLSDDSGSSDEYVEGFMGVGDESWDEWEEWMGWEGAGIRDYTSHVNAHA